MLATNNLFIHKFKICDRICEKGHIRAIIYVANYLEITI